MNQSWRKLNQEKTLFKSYYCTGCKQTKPCGKLTDWDSDWKGRNSFRSFTKNYCCSCYYQSEQVKAEEYSDYQQVYQRKEQEQKEKFKQYQLLRSYQGCKRCGSLAVDAYHLYNENKLICQPCRMKKEGSASGSISFLEQQKWFKKWWGINLKECLERKGVYSEPSQKFQCLPINAECARKWLKDSNHLGSCQCLEIEVQKHHSLVNDNLKRIRERLKECKCVKSEKVRVGDDNYAWCEICDKTIMVASKKRVIKNRNDPSFWGLEIKEKVLCGNCLASKKESMSSLRRAEFNRYRKVRRL